eukprot:COSAG02_NODE_1830_length_10733_cov_38.842580_4_plen_95_part_00
MLATLLLTALFSQPSAVHAAVNAFQCSAAATALHTAVRLHGMRTKTAQALHLLAATTNLSSVCDKQLCISVVFAMDTTNLYVLVVTVGDAFPTC